MKSPLFTGVCTAIVTPFDGDNLNFPVFDQLIDRQLAARVSAITVCGTTGEAAAMSIDEKLMLIQHAISYADHRCKIIAGTGTNYTKDAIRMSRMAEAYGADGLLVVTPYYNKTSQTGLIRHYEAIADSVSIPIIVYNVPSRTGMHITADTYEVLSRHPNINGVKEASSDLPLISRIRNRCGDDFNIWSGNDDTTVSMMSLGAKGVISTASNLIPKEFVKMCTACLSCDYTAGAKIQNDLMPLIDALFCEVNPMPVKAALRLCGYDVGSCRAPLCDLSPKNLELLEKSLSGHAIS